MRTGKKNQALFDLDIKSKKQSMEMGDIQLEDAQMKSKRRKDALQLSTEIQAKLAEEGIKRRHKNTLDAEIAKMSPEKLDAEYGARTPEEAKQLAYTEIKLPSGKTDEEIIATFKPRITALQSQPEIQGFQTGMTQGRKRAEKLEDVTAGQEFQMGKLATTQGFAQDHQQRSFDQQSKMQEQRLSAQKEMLSTKADIAATTKSKKGMSGESATKIGLVTSGAKAEIGRASCRERV